MEFYEAVYSRRTVRNFSAEKINPEVLKKILDAGLQAPSNNHLRQWEFIIIDDKSVRLLAIDKVQKKFPVNEIESILENWGLHDAVQREMYFNGIPKQYRMLLTAGCLIIPCFYQPYPLLKPEEIPALNYFASVWCCIENILLAASAEGIYGVTRIPFAGESRHLKELLKVPADYEIPCYIALGYPDKNAESVKQIPVKIEERIHYNRW